MSRDITKGNTVGYFWIKNSNPLQANFYTDINQLQSLQAQEHSNDKTKKN